MPCPPVLLLKEGLQEENYNRKGNSYKSYSDGSYSYKEGPYNEGGVLLGQRVSLPHVTAPPKRWKLVEKFRWHLKSKHYPINCTPESCTVSKFCTNSRTGISLLTESCLLQATGRGTPISVTAQRQRHRSCTTSPGCFRSLLQATGWRL